MYTYNMNSLYFDGASRGNPGPASYGGVIYKINGTELLTYKAYIGEHTNNVAEYFGLLVGLRHCVEQNIKHLNVYGDSKLVIEQVKGNWKVRNENLKKIHQPIVELVKKFDLIKLTHIYRKNNKRADQLANEALDEQSKIHRRRPT